MTDEAYIKVVDVRGERNLGGQLATTLVPNRSIYLGGNLVLKINEEESYLQLYGINGNFESKSSISIYPQALSYDYYQ